MTENLQKFKEHMEKRNYYGHAIAQMHWDMQTQTPPKGYEAKVNTITYFSTEAFRMETSKEYGELLEAMSAPEEFEQLDEAMKETVKRFKKNYDESCRIPEDFYAKVVRESALSQKAWEEAKQKNDYSLFAPHLNNMIENQKQLMKYIRPDKEIYDALLENYEEGMDSQTLDSLFSDLRDGLVPLIKKIAAAPQKDNSAFLCKYDVNKQREVCRFLLEYMGFDMEAGVMGESEHPFTMGFQPGDVRVTNHYKEEDAINAMYSIIHEGGHGIFEQGVDPKYENTAIASINYLGLHESQSRFYENILGRNINFWKPIYEKLGELLPAFASISLEDFYGEINRVTPSLIRTEADEVTYSLHVIVRYEIEKAIFRDGVSVEELPKLWNDKMEEYIGVRPACDAEGILQDMHWSDGSFGYFPTYALGNIYDGMFRETMMEELGDLDEILAAGRIKEITNWLHDKIHQHGSMYTSLQVVDRICKKPISAKPILQYFEEKYTKIYDLAE